MCHKIRLFNFHFKVLIIFLKYGKSKNFAKWSQNFNEKILRNRLLCTIAFFAAMFVCLI